MILLVKPIIRLLRQLKVTPITNEPGNEMIRIGIGRNEYRPFARVDAWNRSYRVTKR